MRVYARTALALADLLAYLLITYVLTCLHAHLLILQGGRFKAPRARAAARRDRAARPAAVVVL